MSELDQIIEHASRLPVYDAAYEIWAKRQELDRLEQTSPSPKLQRVNLRDPEFIKRVIRDAYANVQHQMRTAHDGPTFERLKRAHPETSDDELKRAVKAAVKLEQDCLRNFSSQGPTYSDDVTRAIDLAKRDNPGFQEKTYESAWYMLMTAMR
jgi:hypothetical protein